MSMLYAEICPKVRRHNARPCYMPRYVPRLEGIMYSPSGRALCLLTLGHICPCYMPKYVPRLEGIMHDPVICRNMSQG